MTVADAGSSPLFPIVVTVAIVLITAIYYYKVHAQNSRRLASPREIVAPINSKAASITGTNEEEKSVKLSDIASDECAACGKEGDDLKTCTACKLVKYCNSTCQKSHRTAHKKACKKQAAKIFDEALFKKPPPKEDCPICLLRLPDSRRESTYQLCCGQLICIGCKDAGGENMFQTCPFCRMPGPTSEEHFNERMQKRLEANDAEAYNMLACDYNDGENGMPVDYSRAVELLLRAIELGSIPAHYNLANNYQMGRGVERDMKKYIKELQLAAMGGHGIARHNLGGLEMMKGKAKRAMRHYMIAAECGMEVSLDAVKQGFREGLVTKKDFEKTLRTFHKNQEEIKSDQRERARLARLGTLSVH